MTDRPRWTQRLTQLIRPTEQATTPERGDELAPFTDQLDHLRTLAETATDSLTASYYESVWREMGEELGYVADDLAQQKITAADLPSALEEWRAKGRAHLRHHTKAAQVFRSDPDQLARTAGLGSLYTDTCTAAGGDDAWASAEEWLEHGTPPDLGHSEFIQRLARQADAMVAAGDLDTAGRLRTVADQITDHAQNEEWWAMSHAIDATDRQASIEQSRAAAQADMENLLDRYGLQLPPDLPDEQHDERADGQQASNATEESDYEAGARLQRERGIERAVQHAYGMAEVETDFPSAWLDLESLHGELLRQARQAGREPYRREDIDAAVARMTRDGATDGSTVRLSTDPETGRARVIFEDAAPAARDDLTDTPADTDHQVTDDVVADESSSGDGDEFVEKSREEHFEDWMEHEAAQHYGDLDNTENLDAADDTDDPVPVELRGKGWLGDPLTDADKEAAWKAGSGPTAERERPPYGDWAAPGSHQGQEQASQVGDQAAEHSHDNSENNNAVTDGAGVSEPIEAAEAAPAAEKPADEKTADEPVAVTETTACAVAAARAQCVVDQARQQLDAAQQASANERDEELARWHRDDTAAQTDNEHHKDTAAAQADDPAAGL
ncbi:hypothetical protein GCM10009554_46510 [Kribbella koreensis]|uniref:DUF222 domain-containing protein n=1 Tax=Kribbella koreensis TaxID=57909 RepID=A0ABN1QX04_9ACTN